MFHELYDSGDNRKHEIWVLGVFPAEQGTQHPISLKEIKVCPPQDCGGAPGHEKCGFCRFTTYTTVRYQLTFL